ncbi:MAG: glucosaminidase domain-containing protein [Pseudomonadota bacterium]
MRPGLLFITLGTVLAGAGLFGAVLWHCTPVPAPPPVVMPLPTPGETPEEIAERKRLFIDLLLPLIRAENRRLLDDRARIDRIERELANEDDISREDFEWLKNMAGRYNLDPAARRNPDFFDSLRRRVDTLPASMIIAQAALESGWGRSPVTRESNNFFGHYCYEPDCGVPAPGSGDLRVFKSPADSVRAYMHNLNSHRAYADLRKRRAAMRAAGWPVSGSALIQALGSYSERGQAYIDDLATLIRENELDLLQDR